jgi:hypothetical protein
VVDSRATEEGNPAGGTPEELPLEPRPDPYLTTPPGGNRAPQSSSSSGENKLAPLALGSALASFVFLWGVGGLLAIGLGVAARSEQSRRAGGRGASMAAAAIVLGAVNVLVTSAAVALAVLWWGQTRVAWPERPADLAAQEGPPAPRVAPRPVSKPVRNSFVGTVQLIDVDPSVPSLASELERQWEAAHQANERLLVWLVAPACAPCDAVATVLADPRMQEALSGVRLLRIDAARFQRELTRLRLPPHVPGFALMGQNGRALDYVHGGEWDEDIAPNIAPVLGKFVRGEYETRRYPWRGGARDDETAL